VGRGTGSLLEGWAKGKPGSGFGSPSSQRRGRSFVNGTAPVSLSYPGAIVWECSERPGPKRTPRVTRLEDQGGELNPG
jgi:hypothetical protein